MTKMLMTQKIQKISYLPCTLERYITKHQPSRCKYCLRRVTVTWMWLLLKSLLKNSGHPNIFMNLFILWLLYSKKNYKLFTKRRCFESVCDAIKITDTLIISYDFLFHCIILNLEILFFKMISRAAHMDNIFFSLENMSPVFSVWD